MEGQDRRNTSAVLNGSGMQVEGDWKEMDPKKLKEYVEYLQLKL
jgi:hypothetical protein